MYKNLAIITSAPVDVKQRLRIVVKEHCNTKGQKPTSDRQ